MINQLLTFKILYVPKDQREIGPANPASLWFQWCTQGENHWGKLQGSQLIINSSIHIMTDLTDLSGWFSQKPSKILGSCWVCRMVKEHMTISILQDLAMENPWELIIFDRETTQATSQVPLFNISTQLWSIAYSVWWDTWFTYSKWRFPENNSILIPSPGMPGMMPCMGCMGGNMPGMGGNMPGMGGMPGVSPREGVKIFGLFQSQSFRSFRT